MSSQTWTRIKGAATLRPGEMRRLVVEGRVFVLINRAGEYFVLDGRCTHKPDALLCEGIVFEDTVMCPWHGFRYDIRTGRNVHPGNAKPVGRVPLRIDGEDLLLDLG